MPKNYRLKFNLSSVKDLDGFALLAVQKYNLGDKGDWFGHFRGGLGGFTARIAGVQIHYLKVHSWNLDIIPHPVEYHLTSILFNMDSAIECLVFALNALGYITDSDKFHNVTDEKELRRISPVDILGKSDEDPSGILPGYDVYFPTLKNYWHENRDLIKIILENHDVSKHREAIYKGGKYNLNPPPGFFKKLGIEKNKGLQFLCSPMEEILLLPEPKKPRHQRNTVAYEDTYKLEEITERFCEFINMSVEYALKDAQENIKLNHYDFINDKEQEN